MNISTHALLFHLHTTTTLANLHLATTHICQLSWFGEGGGFLIWTFSLLHLLLISNFTHFFSLFQSDDIYCCTFDRSYGLKASGQFQPLPQKLSLYLLMFSASSLSILICYADFLTFCSQILNHSRSSLGHYATRSLSVDVSELLNQHMSWGVFHDLFKFGLKLWVMPQKAILSQRTEEGMIITRKELFTICFNVPGDDIGNRHGLSLRAAGFTDPHQCLQQSLFLKMSSLAVRVCWRRCRRGNFPPPKKNSNIASSGLQNVI